MTDDAYIDRRLKVHVSGPKGAGKTNLVAALDHMLSGRGDPGLRGKVFSGDKDTQFVMVEAYAPATTDPIEVTVTTALCELPPRQARTVSQLRELLARMPGHAEVFGLDLKPVTVTPQATGGSILIA